MMGAASSWLQEGYAGRLLTFAALASHSAKHSRQQGGQHIKGQLNFCPPAGMGQREHGGLQQLLLLLQACGAGGRSAGWWRGQWMRHL